MKRSSLALFLAFLLVVVAFSATASATLLYAPIYSTDKIEVANIDPTTGALARIGGSPFSIPDGGAVSWAMTPDGRFGISTYLVGGGVHSFALAPDGAVTSAQDKLSWANNDGYAVAVAPGGKFVYVAQRTYPPGPTPSGVRAYSLSATGQLTELAGSPFAGSSDYFDVAITPDGQKMYLSNGASVAFAPINPDGTIGSVVPLGLGSTQLAISPDGRFVFASGNTGGVGSLSVYAIQPTGSLAPVGAPLLLGGTESSSPSVSANGGFVYLAEDNANKIFTVRIAADGTPSLVGTGTPFNSAQSVAVSPDGKFAYAHNGGTDYSLHYAVIGADGTPGAFTKAFEYDPVEPMRMTFRPGQGTKAEFTPTARTAPLTTEFDAGKTTALLGTVGAYSWDFGDGTTAAGSAKLTHKFSKAGVYDVKLTAADDTGCTTQFVYTGQSTLCNGSASSTKSIKYDTPPWITSLKVSPSKVAKKTKIKFKLTESASVSFYAQKPTKGRTVGTACKKQTKKNMKAKKCTRWVRASKTFRRSGKAGKTNSVSFSGKVGKKKLAKGSYRFYAVATDKAKRKGPSATAKFTVK